MTIDTVDAVTKVLIVDDDESIRALLRVAFSIEEGIAEIREADGGRLAVEECASFRPDVVLLDYWMPEMDGAATASLIRALHPDICIVAYSGFLENVPPWADMLWVKGESLNVPAVLEEARSRRH